MKYFNEDHMRIAFYVARLPCIVQRMLQLILAQMIIFWNHLDEFFII